jgi:hypothetical protein
MFDERSGQFSPDSQWVAYETNESGRAEMVVQHFPEPTSKWQVSTSGGTQQFMIGEEFPQHRLETFHVQSSNIFYLQSCRELCQPLFFVGPNAIREGGFKE